ncbi:hypothetical protein GALMADRAFT_806132 [Galerina marginata CBS 339.88]|uniref:Uncharacterized protein n=1 Tax=Galerina marginata (strain CBS 339.88) TaxID=685588 RepID=A0A067STT6_GALM3|nr:hypothetical protein GALMADRAFT_806132 [Galerina marginata CBS 339.88]
MMLLLGFRLDGRRDGVGRRWCGKYGDVDDGKLATLPNNCKLRKLKKPQNPRTEEAQPSPAHPQPPEVPSRLRVPAPILPALRSLQISLQLV